MSIADDLADGCCCSLCGRYFINRKGRIFEHGYPVYCNDCWNPKCGYEKSLTKTL